MAMDARLARLSFSDNAMHLSQPAGARTELHLTPLELIERLAKLIPPPPLHRHRYHGVHSVRRSALEVHCLSAAGNPALVRTAACWRSRAARGALPGVAPR